MLIASAVLFVVFWQWRTMPAVVWDVTPPIGRAAVWAVFWLGWVTALATTTLSAADREKIAHGNAERLLRI